MSPLPKVSCQCVTYGRPDLLNEALESFLRQDYAGPKELVIVNDYEGMELKFDHPEVVIFNYKKRWPSLGMKRNMCAEHSTGEVLLPWDDDDISMPWRISLSVNRMMEAESNYWKPATAQYIRLGKSRLLPGVGPCHGMAAFTKELWRRVKYVDQWKGCDRPFERTIKAKKELLTESIPEELWFYIYRWDTDYEHLSRTLKTQESYDEFGRSERKWPAGTYHLEPQYSRNYEEIMRTRCAL